MKGVIVNGSGKIILKMWFVVWKGNMISGGQVILKMLSVVWNGYMI